MTTAFSSLVLWLKDVVLQLRYSSSKKRKGDAVKEEKEAGRANRLADPKVKQLAESLEMPLDELLEELPAMLADDKAVEVGEGCAREREGEDLDRFLKAGTVESYVAAVMQLYKVQ